jgi:hypothetical protein
VLGWESFLRARERKLASESVSVKYAETAAVGLEYLRACL